MHGHEDEQHGERHERGGGRALHPVLAHQHGVEDDVDRSGRPGDDPVEAGAPRAADPDRDDDVAGEQRGRERQRRDDALARPERLVRRRKQLHEPGRQQAEAERDPARERDQVGEHERVRVFASPSSSIEYAKPGQARRNAVSRSTIADAIRTPSS